MATDDSLIYYAAACGLAVVVIGIILFNWWTNWTIKDDHEEEPKGSKWRSPAADIQNEIDAAKAAQEDKKGDKKDD